VVTKDCVARWNAVTTDAAGAPLLAADGVVSYKVYLSATAATGGPATPPPGSTVVFSAGPSMPGLCLTLTPGQQYTYWEATILTPLAPPPGQLPGLPAEGPPAVAVPFVMGTAASVTKTPAAATGATISQ